MGRRSGAAFLKQYRKEMARKKDSDFLRLAKCLVAAKDELNMNLFWDDEEERFIRRYIDFVDDASDDDEKACSN